jgi:hypothetical protein
MKSKILIATALASLLVGTGIAGAQGTNENGRNAPGARGATPSTQHAQTPSERTQPGNHMGQSEGSPSGNRMGQQEPKKSGTTNPSAQNERNGMQRNPSAAENERGRQERRGTAERRENPNERSGASENREKSEQNRSTAERPASAALSADQRTKIRSMVLQGNAPRIARSDVNVNLSVGTRIPRNNAHIRLLPLPQTVVEVEPRWRGYDYFLVGDEIVVVAPGTFEIVAIIPA